VEFRSADLLWRILQDGHIPPGRSIFLWGSVQYVSGVSAVGTCITIMEWYAQTQKLGIPRQGKAHPGLLNGVIRRKNLVNRFRLKNDLTIFVKNCHFKGSLIIVWKIKRSRRCIGVITLLCRIIPLKNASRCGSEEDQKERGRI
jgi:hypothetical protein